MDPTRRVVTQIPLVELWDDDGSVEATRDRYLGLEDVRRLVQSGVVRFVVADAGKAIRWVPVDETHVFWKNNVKPRIVDPPDRQIDVYAYPEGYAYLASEWTRVGAPLAPIVLLEVHH
jgi:hypothetical protein